MTTLTHAHTDKHTHTQSHPLTPTGQHVDIIRHCESQVSENGSLVLSTDDVSSGSGMALNVTQPLLPPLPPLPSTVNEVTISLQSNTTVSVQGLHIIHVCMYVIGFEGLLRTGTQFNLSI